jgi:hypothetical protein
VRFVALLWHDSVKESDGMECGTEDEASGFLSAECLDAMDSLIQQATERGLWVIIAARAKYATGWDWPNPNPNRNRNRHRHRHRHRHPNPNSNLNPSPNPTRTQS